MTQKEQQTVPVVKSVNEELRQATYVVLVPDEVDLHGDIVSEDEVRKAIEAAVYEVNRELHDEKLKESQLQNTNPVPSNDKIDNTGNVIPDEDTVTEEAVG